MAVLFGRKLPPTSKVYFQFQLPGQKSSVRLSGQVLWQDWNGRAGVQFVDVPKTSRRLLDQYLNANLPNSSEPFPLVTVELEEPLPPEPVPVGTSPQQQAAPAQAAAGQPVARRRSEPDNRRGQTRYACRLGAEVYRTGILVPHYCCLTDLNASGCYLEVHLPFPKGTSVEITVRTYELKLRFRGTVQTSHPGFGMGVAFALETQDERDQVQTLTDFVAATQEGSN